MCVMNTPVKKLAVFIIEDDLDDQVLLKLAFEITQVPLTLKFANNCNLALTSLLNCPAEEQPDIIISDFNMPLMNGEEFLHQLRADTRYDRTTKVILSTAASPLAIENCLANGASRYIVKPYHFDDLVCAVKEIIVLHQEKYTHLL